MESRLIEELFKSKAKWFSTCLYSYRSISLKITDNAMQSRDPGRAALSVSRIRQRACKKLMNYLIVKHACIFISVITVIDRFAAMHQ